MNWSVLGISEYHDFAQERWRLAETSLMRLAAVTWGSRGASVFGLGEQRRRTRRKLGSFPSSLIAAYGYAGGPSVPTWNYVDVHAYGPARLVEDGDWLRGLLRGLTDRHEAGSPAP
jgi:Putative FMN-binding domain